VDVITPTRTVTVNVAGDMEAVLRTLAEVSACTRANIVRRTGLGRERVELAVADAMFCGWAAVGYIGDDRVEITALGCEALAEVTG
jgi:hypothetical protein